MTNFPFNDLHSFKDFVVFVQMRAPNNFPLREGVPSEDQWTLDLAFRGLRDGLALAVAENMIGLPSGIVCASSVKPTQSTKLVDVVKGSSSLKR